MSGDQALLLELGRRLRRLRENAGLSVSDLARRAELSRRYVTETEAGRANPSLRKLAALSRALGVPLTALCDLPLGTHRGERVALVGLRGAGKSSVGRRLALLMEAPFVELDARVEALAGLSLAEIFALQGESTYRRLEREALEEVLGEGQRVVIATGGSIVHSPETFDRLRESCRTIWLVATPEEHLDRVLSQGDRRPIEGHPRALEELRTLLSQRHSAYSTCEHTLITTNTPIDSLATQALALLTTNPTPHST
jgi:XRE family aerobic/anaerobic benzoate catabolism transcriptional regulator